MQEKTITSGINLTISAIVISFHIFVLLVVPLVLLPISVNWGFLVLPFVLFNITHWALIHEGVHKHLCANSRTNEYTSRLLAIFMGASFHLLKFGHLMHHKLNRHWECEVVDNSNWRNKLDHYWTLLGGLYLIEMVSTFMIALMPKQILFKLMAKTAFKHKPEILPAADRFFYQKKNINLVRTDTLLIALIYGGSFYLYGAHWLFLAGFLIGRALVISFMDNIYHYDTAVDNTEAGKDLALPKVLALAFLNGNYHETHHLNSDVPWWQLPQLQSEQGRGFDGKFIEHGLMQFKGPVVKTI